MIRTWNPVMVPTRVAPEVTLTLKAQAEAKFHMYYIGLH
jgi:hypothetical protein